MSINDVLNLRQFLAFSLSVENGVVSISGELQDSDKTCPACGKDAQKPHQYYEKRVRHLSFGGLPTYLVFERKDWICSCGKVFLERLEFQDLGSNYSRAYEEYIYQLACKQDFQSIAKSEGLSWSIVNGIFKKNQPPPRRGIKSQRRVAEYSHSH